MSGDKRQEMYNFGYNKQVNQNTNSRIDDKNESDISNDLNSVKRKETDRKDIKDISDFIKNKKNDKK